MSNKYAIDQATKTLVFTGNPKSLKTKSVERKDKQRVTSVVVPNSVSTITPRVFANCTSLASVHIPNSVSAIGYEAFESCFTLASVHIPNSCSIVGFAGFNNCRSLASVYIPNSTSTIDINSFINCRSLASVYIPNSVFSVKYDAFAHCSRLHKAYLSNNSKISIVSAFLSFLPKTSLIRPRIKPVTSLFKKHACRASKASYSVYL